MNERDPERWSAQGSAAPPELREWLNAAKRDLPGPEALAALGIVLPPAPPPAGLDITAAGAKTQAAAGAGKTVGAALAGKVLAGVVVVGAVSTGVWLGTQRDGADTPSLREHPLQALSEMAAAGVASSLSTAIDDGFAPDQTLDADDEPAADAASAEKHLPQTGVSPPGTESELQLLHRARRALKAEPGLALSLVQRHSAAYPNSNFAQEREAIRIRALQELGREQEAKRQREAFERRFPGSAHQRELGGR